MGCVQSGADKEEKKREADPVPATAPAKTVDPRLPFATYRQLFNFRNSWKTISRNLENTAKHNLLRFFRTHPEHKNLFKKLKSISDEALADSTAFETQAEAIFNVFDEVMESIEKLDMAIYTLEQAGVAHSSIPDFKIEFFQDMEASFLEAARSVLEDRFTEPTKNNFRMFYQFCVKHIIDGFNRNSKHT